MTDPWNNDFKGTPHSIKPLQQITDYVEVFDDLCNLLRMDNLKLGDDLTILWARHPAARKGLEFPSWFKCYTPIYNFGTEGRSYLQEVIQRISSTNEFAEALFNPLKSKYDLKAVAAEASRWGNAHTSPIDFLPQKANVMRGEQPLDYGRAWLPLREWFDPGVQKLDFGDIFTIWSGKNLELMKLFIGRVVVGPSNEARLRTHSTLLHTYRNIVVVNGSFAGQGKSTLFRYFNDALRYAGYIVADGFPSLGSRFNLAAPVTSEFMYKDDITTASLNAELHSEVAKIVATGGSISTEEKGENARTVRSRAAVLYCANRIEWQLRWGLDDGMNSRLLIIPTIREGEVPQQLLPFTQIPALAKGLDVHVDTIMLWACRLAADEFLKYTGDNAILLKDRISEFTDGSENGIDELDAILSSFVLCLLLMGKDVPETLTVYTLSDAIYGFRALKQLDKLRYVVDSIIKSYKESGKMAWHPARGFILVDVVCLSAAHRHCPGRDSSAVYSLPNEAINNTFKSLSLKTGVNCRGNAAVIIQRWKELVSNDFSLSRIKHVAEAAQQEAADSIERFPDERDRKGFMVNLVGYTRPITATPAYELDGFFEEDI